MWGIAWWLCLFAVCSSVWDFHTYPTRQLNWERAHPGVQYTPGYRKKARKAQKVYDKYQQQKENGNG